MIEVRNSSIVIDNYDLEDNKKMERYLTVYEKMKNGYYLPKNRAFTYLEEERKLIIPRGYNIARLKKIFEGHKVKYSRESDQSARILLNLKRGPRDSDQEEAIDFLLGNGEYEDVLYNTQKFLSLKTGFGKTYCMVNAICQMKRRAIIIVDTKNIKNLWIKEFKESTNIKDSDIYEIEGTPSINKLFKDKKFGPDYKIYIAMHQTLKSLADKDPNMVTKLFKKIKVGCKVFDEAHAQWINVLMIDALTNTERTFYLTATPGRSDPDENKIFNYAFEKVPLFGRKLSEFDPSVYKYETEELDKDKRYIKVYYVTYNSHPSYNNQVLMTKKGYFDMNSFSDYNRDIAYDTFYSAIKMFVDICLSKKGNRKIVIILDKNDMIQKIFEDFSNEYKDIEVGRFCGLVSDKKKEEEKEKRIVLSTMKSLGKAINVDNIGYLINTSPFASSLLAEQLIGRLRKNAKFSYLFDLADIGFSNCKNNQKYRGNSYNKIAVSTRNTDLK